MIFVKLISHETYFNSVWRFAQIENKLFSLEINWKNTILQEFSHGNDRKLAFCKINCEPFCWCGCFVSGILLLNMLISNRKESKNAILSGNFLGKVVFHETKKWTICDVNCKPFDKCECFVSGILSLNMLNSNMKKLKFPLVFAF